MLVSRISSIDLSVEEILEQEKAKINHCSWFYLIIEAAHENAHKDTDNFRHPKWTK
jgi:hypothetical protein